MSSQLKIVGSNGQIYLGKEFAGQIILFEKVDAGTWVIKTGSFIPHNEKWQYVGSELETLDNAISTID